MLSHEKLDAYQCAIEYVAVAVKVVESVPRGYGELRDQLRRASMSVPLNIAEGAGKSSPSDRRKFYEVSRASAQECAAIFDTLQVMDAVERQRYEQGKNLLRRIVSMITKMCQAADRRPD